MTQIIRCPHGCDDTITTLREQVADATKNLNIKADFIEATLNDSAGDAETIFNLRAEVERLTGERDAAHEEIPLLSLKVFNAEAERDSQQRLAIAAIARAEKLEAALNVRDMGINPNSLILAADEIDCCPDCDCVTYDASVNHSACRKSDKGDYCPNDVAETLRAVAKACASLTEGD